MSKKKIIWRDSQFHIFLINKSKQMETKENKIRVIAMDIYGGGCSCTSSSTIFLSRYCILSIHKHMIEKKTHQGTYIHSIIQYTYVFIFGESYVKDVCDFYDFLEPLPLHPSLT